jgi:hypothetical protein
MPAQMPHERGAAGAPDGHAAFARYQGEASRRNLIFA